MRNEVCYQNEYSFYFNTYQDFPSLLTGMLQRIAKELLCYKDGYIFVRKDGFREWMELISLVSPTLFIAAFLIDYFKEKDIANPSAIKDFSNLFLTQFEHTAQPLAYIPELSYLIDKKGLNDLHIHLNGSTESDSVWLYILANPYKTAKDYSKVYNSKDNVRILTEQTIANCTSEIFLNRILEA